MTIIEIAQTVKNQHKHVTSQTVRQLLVMRLLKESGLDYCQENVDQVLEIVEC